MIDDLMFSDADAKDIVNQHAQAKLEAEMAEENRPKFSTGKQRKQRNRPQ